MKIWFGAAVALPVLCQSPGDLRFFESKVRPILAAHCYSCHSSQARTPFAGLRLDSRAAMLEGGHSGPAIVPGQPSASRLIQAISYESNPKMPPAGRLAREEIQSLTDWVRSGAYWPVETQPTAQSRPHPVNFGRDHWAWQPLSSPVPPPVDLEYWPADRIDRFVLSKLEASGLTPALEAGRHVLLRRLTFDLTGLPPTPAEMDRFLNDAGPRAYERLVDRLLASPGFGERFARHWLDGTYYADNIEIGRRIPARDAWRYRDYVIDAFNQDMPYDRFLREQIAGDLMPAASPADRRRHVIATGFLALGPWALVQADKDQLRMDVVDMQVDMIGRTVLGLTLGCARCHDHKFDPLPQRDYYALAGIFRSTQTLSGRVSGIFSDVNQRPLPESPIELRARAAALELWEQEHAAAKAAEAAAVKAKKTAKESANLRNRIEILEYTRPGPPSAYAVQDVDFPADCRITIRGNAALLGGKVPRGALSIVPAGPMNRIADFTSGRLELADWITSPGNPLTARVAVNRIWHFVFGQGIVPSIDNFGLRGAEPSHPAMLDDLARRFVANGWSVKKLVREMVLSRTYRQGSGVEYPKAQTLDPSNRLLWRMNLRRLEAEAIRDAMIAVTGRLDTTRGGQSLPLKVPGNANLAAKPEFIEDRARLDTAQEFRRTIYLPNLRRGQLQSLDVLNLFDFPDNNQVTGVRPATTVPTQALFLMNSPFVRAQARAIAVITTRNAGDQLSDRLPYLVKLVFGRSATVPDFSMAVAFLNDARTKGVEPSEAWTRYCHALLVSNEFLYRR